MDESYAYQQFSAGVEEEEAWIAEKQHLLSAGDHGDTMATVQGLLKKHEVFETDFQIHRDRCNEIKNEGEKLVAEVLRTDFFMILYYMYISFAYYAIQNDDMNFINQKL